MSKDEVREHVLIFSGFIGASALTAIILIITITTTLGSQVHGGAFPVTMFSIAFILSVGAGFGSFLGTDERQRGSRDNTLVRFSEVMLFLAVSFLTATIPNLVGGFVSGMEVIAIYVTLYATVATIVILWGLSFYRRSRSRDKKTDQN